MSQPTSSRSVVRLKVEAIVVDRDLFQEWSRAGYDVVWEVPSGTPILNAQYAFGRTITLEGPPPPPPPPPLPLWLLPPLSPAGLSLPREPPVSPGGEEGGEGSSYRQPSAPPAPSPSPSPSPAVSSAAAVDEPECFVDEPDEEQSGPSEDKGKKPAYQSTASTPTGEFEQSPPAQPSEGQWEEYSAEKWERATLDDTPNNSGYSLRGASLSNAVTAMPRLSDLPVTSTSPVTSDPHFTSNLPQPPHLPIKSNPLVTSEPHSTSDTTDTGPAEQSDGKSTTVTEDKSGAGSDVHATGIDWTKVPHHKPMKNWTAEEQQALRNMLAAKAERDDQELETKKQEVLEALAKAEEYKKTDEYKAQRRERLFRKCDEISQRARDEQSRMEAEEAEKAKAKPLSRNQKRALKKKEEADRKKLEKEAEEEAKRKAALAKAALAKATRVVPKPEDIAQQKPSPVQRVGGRRVTKKRPGKPKQEQSSEKPEVQGTEETAVTEERATQSRTPPIEELPIIIETLKDGTEKRIDPKDPFYKQV